MRETWNLMTMMQEASKPDVHGDTTLVATESNNGIGKETVNPTNESEDNCKDEATDRCQYVYPRERLHARCNSEQLGDPTSDTG
jgi:hypothetical protein